MVKLQIKRSETNGLWYWITVLCGGISLALLAYFAATTVYSSDDYWYSTFWDHGLKHYLEMMDYHYRVFNGRTLVHALAHIILHFDNWAFVVVCCGLCLTAVLGACRAANMEKEQSAVTVCFFLAGLLLMPTSFFTQGMMWISAFCNYLFPAVLVSVLVMAMERNRRSLWLFAAAFLAGATTEQMGLTAVAVAAVYAADALLRREEPVRCLAAVGFAAAGVWTVFASPATSERASTGIKLDSIQAIVERLEKSIQREAWLLTENPMPVLLMLLFFLLAAWAIYRLTQKRCQIAVSVIGAVSLLAGVAGTDRVRLLGFVMAFVALAVLAIWLIAARARCSGMLMLAALASAAVMLPTNTVESRVMLPFYVLALLSVCVLWGTCKIRGNFRAISAAALLCVTIVCLIPAFAGYWRNYKVDRLNKDYAGQFQPGGVLSYCIDYDLEYTWVKADFDPYFKFKYLESLGLPEDTPVHFYSADGVDGTPIYYGKKLLSILAYDDGGVCLLPIRTVVETCGGTLEWMPERTTVVFDGCAYQCEPAGNECLKISWMDRQGQPQEALYRQKHDYGTNYVELSFFTDVLGIRIVYDDVISCYVIKP